MTNFFKGKSVLITGGSGTIGKALAIKALSEDARAVKIFSNDENGQYEMEQELDDKRIEFLLGDIRDDNRVNHIVKGVDIIYHAAALKHVDRCEYNPFEAVSVNIIGTKNIISAALREKVHKVISISSDKAVNPVSVMGGTKLLTEKLISAEIFNKNSNTSFASVRFGNVLISRGSILPKIENQISQGGPITLTDERMKRYFMTVNDAINLIISATKMMRGGEIFVFKMPLIYLKDLFEVLRERLASKYGLKPSQIKIKIIGKRAGEKLIEDLLSDFEMDNVLETKNFFIIPHSSEFALAKKYPGAKKAKNVNRYFKNQKTISKTELTTMLKKYY